LEFSIEIISYILVAITLAMLPFSVGIFSSAYRCIQMNESFVIGMSFSFFQGFLLILGWWVGHALVTFFASLSFSVATILLIMVAVKMFFDARRAGLERRTYSVRDFKVLLGFSFAISINAFLVGVSLGMIGARILIAAALQVLITYLATLTGIRLGKMGRYRTAIGSEHFGAFMLLLMAIVMIVRYLNLV
jgi:putative Mn2+ efflux pump MntP